MKMKNRTLCVLLSIAVGLLGTARLSATDPIPFVFDIPLNGGLNEWLNVSASGVVDFNIPLVDVDLYNTSADPSYIVGFWILKPMTSLAMRLDAVSVDLNGAWSMVNTMDTQMSNFGVPLGDYFGVQLQGSPLAGLGSDGMLSFSFTMRQLLPTETIDWDAYLASQNPHVFVRWRGVGMDGEDSDKGYGYFTPIPEPRLIAPLAVLAMGGLLYGRRRLAKKA